MTSIVREHMGSMTPSNIFPRSVVGIDRSDESLEAARQALRLADGEGDVALLTAWALAPPLAVPYAVVTPAVLDDEGRRLEAEHTVRAAALARNADVKTSTVRGLAWQALIDVAEAQKRTLIAVGSHGDR